MITLSSQVSALFPVLRNNIFRKRAEDYVRLHVKQLLLSLETTSAVNHPRFTTYQPSSRRVQNGFSACADNRCCARRLSTARQLNKMQVIRFAFWRFHLRSSSWLMHSFGNWFLNVYGIVCLLSVLYKQTMAVQLAKRSVNDCDFHANTSFFFFFFFQRSI